MRQAQTRITYDLITRAASLRRRIRNLLDGVTPMPFWIGAYGLNTAWKNLTPRKGWHIVGSGHVQVRVRSDVIYLRVTGGTGVGIAPVSSKGWPTTAALTLPGKPDVYWPSYRVKGYALTATGGSCEVTVKPNGEILFTKPTKGRIIRPGSVSWPRG